MRNTISAITLALVSTVMFAQAPVTAPAPQLTKTEQLAVRELDEELNNIQVDINALQQEISVSHPGYHVNLMSGQLEANPPAPKPAPKVNPAPTEKK